MLWRLKVPIILPSTFKTKHFYCARHLMSYKILADKPTNPHAPPILIFHGFLGCKKQWEGLGKTMMHMTERATVVVDLRNHGMSPHFGSHKYEELAQDIVKLCDKLGICQATLVGHSIGGRASMALALIQPKKVSSLLVIDISPATSPIELTDFFPKVMKIMKEMDFKGCKTTSESQKEAKKRLRRIISDETTMSLVLMNIQQIPDKGIGWKCNLDTLLKDAEYITSFPQNLKKPYFGPTLFLGGQFSEYIPPDDLPRIREIFPTAVIKYLPKTGHNLHVDDPKGFLEEAIKFLRIKN